MTEKVDIETVEGDLGFTKALSSLLDSAKGWSPDNHICHSCGIDSTAEACRLEG